ncbi:MAG: helix-turn-helix domain-containing protein [Nitrososphaeraceae archaeon]
MPVENLTFRIPQNLKGMIIRLWSEGDTRRKIAKSCGVSEGTVYNVVEEWKELIGQRDAEAIRELSTSTKRNGIDIGQCAQGFRIHVLLKKIGVTDEDELESFLSTIYEKCRREIVRNQQVAGVSGEHINTLEKVIEPGTVATYIKEMINFSEQGNVSLSGIPPYIKQERAQKDEIVKEKDIIMKQNRILLREASNAQERYENALKKENVTYEQLSAFTRVRAELKKFGLDIDHDLQSVVELMDTIGNKFGYDPERIISEFQDLNIQVLKKKHLSRDVNELENRKEYLMQTSSVLQHSIEFHSQGLHAYRDLEAKGLGFRKLRILSNAISEIARENGIPEYAAADRLFKKIEKMYGMKLRQLDEDPFAPPDTTSVYAAMSERVNLYFYPENE